MRDLTRIAALGGGALVVLGVVWPLGALGEQLFAFHMTQHLLLVALAAPLLVLGGVRMRVGPVTGWIIFVCVFLFWHWPASFQWAALHGFTLLEMASILAAAILFWSVALGEDRLNDGARALYVVTAAVVTDLPGVVMLFAPRAICTMPAENAAAFHLTALQDQQIAGVLMWVPANLVFFGIATFLFARWISDPQPCPLVPS
jgi:cytochrome c oxidase assembly factor CtaG